MRPFIKLDTPELTNVPDDNSARIHESALKKIYNMLVDNCQEGSLSPCFRDYADDDLGKVVENEIGRILDERESLMVSSDTTAAEAGKNMEEGIRQKIAQVIRKHLSDTKGNIGHFPYGDKRRLTAYSNEGKIVEIYFDPFELYWADATLYLVQEAASKNLAIMNEEAKKEEIRKEKAAKDPTKLNKTFLIISSVMFLISLILTLIFKQTDHIFLLMILTELLIACPVVFLINLIKMFRNKKLRYSKPAPMKDFYTQTISNGVGMSCTVEMYDKDRFVREVKELHAYYSFMKLWSEKTGRELPFRISNGMKSFYSSVEPFIIGGSPFEL